MMGLFRRRRRDRGNEIHATESVDVDITLTVNGRSQVLVRMPATTSLLRVLRNEFGYSGPKEACARGECGACTVIVGNRPVLACITLAARVDEPVVTIEGLAEPWSDLRTAFAETGGFQCGFCTPGQITCAAALIESGRANSRETIRHAMSGNICRCTGYVGIVDAVERVSRARGSSKSEVDSP